MQDHSAIIAKCNLMACNFIDGLDVLDDIQTNELMRQVSAAYVFGFVNAFAFEQKLTPPQVHGIILSVLATKLLYSDQQAADFAQILIESTKKTNDPTTNAIIHHGINSYYQYSSNNIDVIKQNFYNIISKLGT